MILCSFRETVSLNFKKLASVFTADRMRLLSPSSLSGRTVPLKRRYTLCQIDCIQRFPDTERLRNNQCCGSLNFGVDPDPHIHDSDLWIRIRILLFSSCQPRCQPKINLKKKFFCILLFEGTFTSFFKDKKSKGSHKTAEIKVLLTFLLNARKMRIQSRINCL